MEIDRTLTNTQLEILRDNWSTEKECPELTHLIRLIDHFQDDLLKQVAEANIKFLSFVARMRLENGRSLIKK